MKGINHLFSEFTAYQTKNLRIPASFGVKEVHEYFASSSVEFWEAIHLFEQHTFSK